MKLRYKITGVLLALLAVGVFSLAIAMSRDAECPAPIAPPAGAQLTHHNASMQIVPDANGRSRFIWISDYLPAEIEPSITPLAEEGCRAIRRNLRASSSPDAGG